MFPSDFAKGRKYYYAVGRRKTATATVRLYPNGKGIFLINGIDYKKYFPYFEFQKIVIEPLDAIKQKTEFDATIKVQGGGIRSQAESIRLGISRALVKMDETFKPILKKLGLLTRDPREKERKKYGLKRARRAPQWSKR